MYAYRNKIDEYKPIDGQEKIASRIQRNPLFNEPNNQQVFMLAIQWNVEIILPKRYNFAYDEVIVVVHLFRSFFFLIFVRSCLSTAFILMLKTFIRLHFYETSWKILYVLLIPNSETVSTASICYYICLKLVYGSAPNCLAQRVSEIYRIFD